MVANVDKHERVLAKRAKTFRRNQKDDPKLSSKTVADVKGQEQDSSSSDTDPEERLENIRKKLKTDKTNKVKVSSFTSYLDEEKKDERQKKFEEIKKEIENVKKEYHKNKLRKDVKVAEEAKEEEERSETFKEYKSEYDRYKDKKKSLPKKGAGREQFTLGLLAKFKNRMNEVKEKTPEEKEENQDDVDNDESWMSHELRFKDETLVLAKDANRKDDDWFEIYDPRNPLNKRRRGEQTSNIKK